MLARKYLIPHDMSPHFAEPPRNSTLEEQL